MRRWRVLSSLSPQRRRTAFVAAGLALAAIVIGIGTTAIGSGPSPASQSRLGPVILVPGYGGQLSSLDAIAARLRGAGRQVRIVALPDGGIGDLTGQAAAVQAVVARELASGAPSVDLVGYSAGGVVVRLWAHQSGHARHARRIVTIGSPQHGTSVAAAAGTLLGGACAGACAQLEPGSALLDSLNSGDETPAGPEWVAIWTNGDQTVVPADSARLDGADNIPLQSVCPTDTAAHSQEPRDPAVIGLVVSALGIGALPHPGDGSCQIYTALATLTAPPGSR